MLEGLWGNFSYFAMIFIGIINLINVANGSGNTFMSKYNKKLTDKEKECFDEAKVKAVQVLYALSLIVLAVLAFVFIELYPNIIAPNIFDICFIIEIVILFIINTKWFLNVFCKRR